MSLEKLLTWAEGMGDGTEEFVAWRDELRKRVKEESKAKVKQPISKELKNVKGN